MSMEQIDRYLRACPRATQFPDFQEQYIFHFIYDYYLSPDEFIGRFPSARPVGVAWLPEWAWHINEKGKANIRKIYFDGKATPEHDYLCPAPATKGDLLDPLQKTKGTLGWVFRLDRADDEKLHQEHGITRIRMAQYVQIRTAPEKTQFGRCSIYFDPRHTSDAPRARNENPETQIAELAENQKWMAGLEQLAGSGAPFWYLQMIRNQILGAFRDPEPIFIRPSDLFIKESCQNAPRVPISSPTQVAPEQQRPAQPVREQTKKSGQTPNKKVAGQAQIPDQRPKQPNQHTKKPVPENQANASTRPSTTNGLSVKFVQKRPEEGDPGSLTTTMNGPKKNPPKKRPADGKQGGSQPKKPRSPPGPSRGQQQGSQVFKRPPLPARRQRRPPPGPSGLCHVETP